MFACLIFYKAVKKERYLQHNRKLVKDKDWQDIHMQVPTFIIKLTKIQMAAYIIFMINTFWGFYVVVDFSTLF